MTPAISRARVLEVLQAFKSTAVLRTALELRIYDVLAAGPRTPDSVAAALHLDERGVRILLGALAAHGLAESDGITYAALEGTAELLVTGSPGYVGASAPVLAADWEWAALRDLASTVRNGQTAAGLDTPDMPYWVDFAEQYTFVAELACAQFLKATAEWAAARDEVRVLDLACGNALFGCEFAHRHPHARVTAIDGRDVLPAAQAQAARSQVADRVRTRPGDAFTDDLGGSYDLIILANLLPLFSPERGIVLLQRLAEAIDPGGRLTVVGFTTGERPPTEEHPAWQLSLMMLAGTAGGETHSLGTYHRMLAAAGFVVASEDQVGDLPLHVVVARKAPCGRVGSWRE